MKLTAVVGKCSRNIAFTPFGVPPPHIFDKCSHNGLASAAIVICRLAANKTETFRPIRIGDMTKTIYGMGREIESKGLLFLCHPLCKRPMNTNRNLDVGLLHFVEAEQTTLPAVACVCSAGSNVEPDLCRSVDARPIGIDAIDCPARTHAFELSPVSQPGSTRSCQVTAPLGGPFATPAI